MAFQKPLRPREKKREGGADLSLGRSKAPVPPGSADLDLLPGTGNEYLGRGGVKDKERGEPFGLGSCAPPLPPLASGLTGSSGCTQKQTFFFWQQAGAAAC